MKKLLTIVSALALLLMLGALPAAAAGVAPTASPTTAPFIDNGTHTIAAGTSQWYRFDYAGDRSGIILTVPNGALNGLAFNVWTPTEVTDWWQDTPVGRGTPNGDDLSWQGDFNMAGSYFVEVMNNTVTDMPFQLMIQGTGIALAAAPASQVGGAGMPAGQPPALSFVPVGPMSNTDPGHALAIDNLTHTVPANTAVWYRFTYAGDKSDITITLPNGALNGLDFNVWTAAGASDWWDLQPVGRGTSQSGSNDLDWVGRFDLSGTYFIQVINATSTPMGAQLMIQGTGVTL